MKSGENADQGTKGFAGAQDMIKGVGHIGIAVRDIEKSAAQAAKALGLPTPPITDNPARKMKVAVLELGAVALEFLEDYSQDGEFARFVRERGNAIHHFCLLTDDIEADLRALEQRGVEMAFREPKKGLRGKRIVFTKPSALLGIPFELSEP